ncbi:MAG: dihydroorotate dehydrogenase electron transfer subunit [Bacteroidales bacterium]|nr:dihydroorotate dehydrogenase electron transfer subunit [Bacteroidales bacterium]
MKYQQDLMIEKKEFLNKNNFLLILKSRTSLPEILPGQFVNILVHDVADRLLRRPISIHDADYSSDTISVVVQKIGKATEKLSLVNEGEVLNVVFPLGNSFSVEEKRPLLVGGGVGTAPLYYLAKKYYERGIRPVVLIGARTKEQLFLIEKYSSIADVYISIEDGSAGEKGLVTDNSILQKEFSAILTCGPTPMMKAVNKEALKKNIPCYVSLENRMACGIGACLCCVSDTVNEGNVCVCTKGPVFDANDLKW